MIAHKVVQELGLEIEQASTSLIISATGTFSRPLGIIRDLPVQIEGITVPITVEVVTATSYSLLLGNDWSKKVEANYNWKNGCYSFKWKNRKYHTPTTYETDQPLPAQPTVTKPEELDLYEQEFLTPKEAYAFETQDSDSNNDWTVIQSRRQAIANSRTNHAPPAARVCGNCGSPRHLFAHCPTNRCNRCQQTGHIAVHCTKQAPKRTTCRTCNQDHLYRQCPQNQCHGCQELGHIEIDCPMVPLK